MGSAGLEAPVLLLQAGANERHPAYWQPITGGVEPGETPEQACPREVQEETGIVLEAAQTVRLDHCFDVQIGEHLTIHKTLFVAVTEDWQVQISDEHIGWQWVPFQKAKELLYWPSNREAYKATKQFLRG